MEDQIQTWREAPDSNCTGFGPYLPETYFVHKRQLLHRPYCDLFDRNKANKRIRIGESPLAHRELAAAKKLERESAKQVVKGVCSVHRDLIDVPVQVLKCLQTQGVTLNRTQEAMDFLMAQVNDFSNSLQSAISRLEGTGHRPPDLASIPVLNTHQYELFTAYYRVVCHMLKEFRQLQSPYALTGVSTTMNRSRSGPQYVKILETFECIKRIRELLISQCHFDCDASADDDSRQFNWPPTPGSVSFLSGQKIPTWEGVCESLERMETNMRKYIEYIHVQRKIIKGKSSVGATRPSSFLPQALNSSISTIPVPIYSSTPFRNPAKPVFTINPTPILKKKRSADVFEDEKQAVAEEQERKKLMPRRVSFGFNLPDAMDTD